MKESKSLKDISEILNQIEYIKTKTEFVKSNIPDVQTKIHNNGITFTPKYASKTVNQNYTNLEYRIVQDALSVCPYIILDFTYNGKSEEIKIYSNPGTSRLAYVSRHWVDDNSSSAKPIQPAHNVYGQPAFKAKPRKLIYTLNFSKITVNFKNNNFNDNALNDCRLKILEFMQRYPNHKVNAKHMDSRLKKLMAFS